MRTQQQAEREEQQRIKNLVLNYDLRNEDTEGDDTLSSPFARNLNRELHQSDVNPRFGTPSALKRGGLKRHSAWNRRPSSSGSENRTRADAKFSRRSAVG